MTLNPTLMALLACPSDDHAPLREERHDGTETLVCTFCATRYPVLDGIPVLLLDDATPGPNGVGVAAEPAPPLVPADSVVAAEPVGDEIAAVAHEPASAPVPPQGPLTVDAFADRVPVDPRPSPKHALPDTEAAAEPSSPAETQPDVEVEPEAAVEAESEAAAATPPPGPRTRTGVLRDRVQQRLAELEATRGPRGSRRGGNG
jgi:uncharacterized protein YbaR (Trm112 family)